MHSADLINKKNFDEIMSEREEIAKQLGGFSKKLRQG